MDRHAPVQHHAIWIDPVAPLGVAQRASIARAGWRLTALTEIPSTVSGVDAVVVRLSDDTEPLIQVRSRLRTLGIRASVVCRVAADALDLADQAIAAGAAHLLDIDDCSVLRWRELARHLEAGAGSTATPAPQRRRSLGAVFVDPVSQHLLALARRVAQAEVTTLLTGPTGAGKEVLARVLHESSPRARGPFVALNCAAMPEHLIEDLLFGHEKGAFTGAHRDHRGLFEQAQGGSLFLDEIGDMPLPLQAKLLRVLQERQVTRLGGHTTVDLDVRVIAATARDLRAAIAERAFREDLYYRIASFQLKLAPLAQRPADILPLAAECLARHPAPGGGAWEIDPHAQALLLRHPWPGNVRELENVVLRAAVLANDRLITPSDLLFDDGPMPRLPGIGFDPPAAATVPDAAMPTGNPAVKTDSDACAPTQPLDLCTAVRDNEFQIVQAALAACDTRDEAARRLGISPRTLRYKLAQWRELGMSVG